MKKGHISPIAPGTRINHLTFVQMAHTLPRATRKALVYFVTLDCDCGNRTTIRKNDFLSGRMKSCGCVRMAGLRARAKTIGFRHAGVGTPTYSAWKSMKARCKPYNKQAKDYIDRGITVCERWSSSFENFRADMGEKPLGLTLERINNDMGYMPGNCRWATMKEQAANRRPKQARSIGCR